MNQSKDIQLIIPMSGVGRRFVEAGYKEPKPLIEVDGYPIIKHVLAIFPGVEDVTFIVNEKHVAETRVLEILETLSPACKIFLVPDENRKGPVDAVSKIYDCIDDTREVIVSYCDYGTEWDFNSFLYNARSQNWDGGIPCYTGFHPHMLGSDNYAFCREENNLLLEIKEKQPFTDNKMNEYASNGTYYFKSGAILKKYFTELTDLDLNLNGEYYVSMVNNLLVRDGLKVGIFEIKKMLQWGTPYDLEVYKDWSSYFSKKEQLIVSNPTDTTLILPMAGYGSRFSTEGYSTPKPLLDVNGKAMIIRAVDCLPKCDRNIFICLEDHFNDYDLASILEKEFENVEVKTIKGVTDGQAITCQIGMKELNTDKPIFISACDNGVIYNEQKYLELINNEDIDVIVWSFRNNPTSKINPNMYSWLSVDKNDNIKSVSCKKFVGDNPLKNHAIIGTMFFRRGSYFLEGLDINIKNNIRTNNEFYVDDVINRCIERGLNVKVFEVDNYICWGTPNDYRTYNYWLEYFSSK
jgi:NDP-sugar pyrophosphorylase family protein